MAYKQISKANNEGLDPVNTATNFSRPSAVTETLRRETAGLDAPRHEKSINEEFSYLTAQIPALREFKKPVVLNIVVEGLAEYNRKISGGTLIVDTDYVNPLCDISRLGDDCSKGIECIFRHELAHEKQGKSSAEPSLLGFRKYGYGRVKEAACELYAVMERGFEGLVDQMAVMLVVDMCQPYIFLDRESYAADINKWIKMNLDYYAVNRWHDAYFIKLVSKFFKPAKNVARDIPTDYGRITKLVKQKASDIIEALNNSKETTGATKSSLKIISPALYNNSIT